MGITPGVLHLNEGHSGFAVLEAIRDRMQSEGIGFDHAVRRVSRETVFTTHTPVPAGHDRFYADLMEEHLGPMRDALGISQEKLMELGRENPGNQSEEFCMTVLGLKLARRANAVSALHGEVSRHMWTGLYPGKPEDEVPIGHITNGVHVPSWLAPQMFRLYDRHLGTGWQENNADEESQLAHVDALVMKRSYIAVGTNESDADTPLMTFESPLEVFADVDPRTRKVRAALRRWVDNHDSMVRSREEYATLYLPDRTVFYERDGSSGIALSGSAAWSETDRDEHGLGEVPVVPIVNRSRLADRWGSSEFAPILPLAHAANKIATDMMVAAEFVALPLRAIFGVGPEDLEDVSGNKLTALQAMLGRLLTMPDPDGTAKPFEFQSANLSNFHATIDAIAKLVVSITGLPPHALGFTTDNPASADAIRSFVA